jgi:hypothetical protein
MVDRRSGGRVESATRGISHGEVLGSTEYTREKLKKGHVDQNTSLGICSVINIDYEEFYVTLRQLVGSSDEFDRVPVPMTFPGAGNRHFFGAMPEIGDLCVVGWRPHGSGRSAATPIILSWLLPGVWPGREWITTAGFTEDEFDMGSAKNRKIVEGVHDRIRHKLRHMQPGNIVASSSQGSDMVLDEGVTLANRRGNEFRLRDQDQAAVTRALQRFDALAGVRAYHGMVQRDALLLATTMISDGQIWDGPQQALFRDPITDEQLLPDVANPNTFLTPPRNIRRSIQDDETQPLGNAVITLEEHIDPYLFLLRGGIVNSEGYVINAERHKADAVYGGKNMFRVACQSTDNAILDADKATFVEHRTEVAHTTDGRLPVTEQTDMWDAERLPPTDPETSGQRTTLPPNAPFIEHVLGTVVGNDPYSQQGKLRYGVPLVPIIFDGETDSPNPRLAPAKLVAREDSGDAPTPLQEHAATLFRMTPPLGAGATPDTWWSVNKKGQMRVALSGSPKENSLEAALRGGLKLSVGGQFKLLLNDGVQLGSKNGDRINNVGVNLTSEQGAVRIYGGGKVKGAEAVGQRNNPQGKGESGAPSVDIEAKSNARLKAAQKVLVKAAEAETNAAKVELNGHQSVAIRSSDSVETSAKVVKNTSAGKTVSSYSGPKENLPTNGALHEETYSPSTPGLVAKETTFESGDRKETFKRGNHTTTVQVGNMTYETQSGTFKAKSGSNSLEITGSSAELTAVNGDVSMTAAKGNADINGHTGVNISSSTGKATLAGSLSISLQAPISGKDQGSIIVSGSIEPFTGQPFSTWGMGAKFHTVEPF